MQPITIEKKQKAPHDRTRPRTKAPPPRGGGERESDFMLVTEFFFKDGIIPPTISANTERATTT